MAPCRRRLFALLLPCLSLTLFLLVAGCSEDSTPGSPLLLGGDGAGDTTPDPVISSISNGVAGEAVTVTGENFSSTPASNVIVFQPNESATVTAATSSSLTVTLPDEGHVGSVTVTANSKVSEPFAYLGFTPFISGVAPASGTAADPITLTGTGFDCTSQTNNVITFTDSGGTPIEATVVSATEVGAAPNEIVVTVPAGLTPGAVTISLSVSSGGSSSPTTTADFTQTP